MIEAGGNVAYGRVDGRLAVARAFGDFEFKPVVSNRPDITQIFLHPQDDEFLLIGCDGFFDAYQSQEAVTLIRGKLMEMSLVEQDPARVIREAVNEAVFRGKSEDNVTAILVIFKCGIE